MAKTRPVWFVSAVSVSALTFESSECRRSQAAGTSPYWTVCVRWVSKVGGPGELASPGWTRPVWLGSSELQERVPCGVHRRAVSSCDGQCAPVLPGSSHSRDSWPNPHSSASCRSAPQGQRVLHQCFLSYKLTLSVCVKSNECKLNSPSDSSQRARERCAKLLKCPFFSVGTNIAGGDEVMISLFS